MTAVWQRGRRWLGLAVERTVGWALPAIIRLSLRRGLRGVWRIGPPVDLPDGPCIIAPNHHSWWDVYLAWLVAERIGRPRVALMDRDQLERFPFFRRIGVLASDEVRAALGYLERGHVLFVFPEGELRAPGPVGPLHRGVAFFARNARAPVVPVAFRVILRGARRPEAYVSFGTPLPPREGMLSDLSDELGQLLAALDETLAATHPEDVPANAVQWVGGKPSARDRASWWERLWRR